MKKLALTIAAASVACTLGVSHAAVNIEAALPGSSLDTGTGGYAFGIKGVAMVAVKSEQFTFANLDPLANHNMVSDVRGLFNSSLISAGQTEVVNISALSVGQTYGFHCSIHDWMKGQLTVLA